MDIRKVLALFSVILLSSHLTVTTFASDTGLENEERHLVGLAGEVIDRADYTTDEKFEITLDKLLNDPNVVGVSTLDTRDSLKPESLIVDDGSMQPMGMLLPYIKNVRHVGDYKQNATLATVWADPGISASLTNTWGRTATYSSSTGVKGKEVSAGLSFTIGKSYSVSYKGSYTAPKTNNGKKVAYVKLYAKPIRQKYTFDVYEPKKSSLNPFANPYIKTGTGIAYKPIGVSYTKSFVYK